MPCKALEQCLVVCQVRAALVQDDDVQARQPGPVLAERFPDYAFQAIPRGCVAAVLFRYRHTEPCLTAVIFCCQHSEHLVATAAGLVEDAPERRGVRQATRSWIPVIGPFARHVIYFCLRRRRLARGRYGVSSARPFARRRLRTRRPPFVAILARNPWVRARFNALGW